MMTTPSREDVLRFRSAVSEWLGFHYEDEKLDALADVLRSRLEATGLGVAAYLARLAANDRDELHELAERLTVAETYFFRYWDHFRAFKEIVLRDRLRARARETDGRRQLRILSAGCASGEELYSLAILLREHVPDLASWNVMLRGIDVNPAVLAKATRGHYSSWSLREAPADLVARNFRLEGREHVLDDRVRAMATFEERNLVDDDPSFWHPDAFDVVFCRNVTMYFSMDVARATIARIARSLSPGGFLFLGHAETLRGISQDFHLCHTHGTFYYQHRSASEIVGIAEMATDATAPLRTTPVSAALGLPDSSWIDVIQGASDRIAKLAVGSREGRETHADARAVTVTVAAPVDAAPAWDLKPAVELLRQERFAEAMVLLGALPADSRSDLDAQLLRAVLLTNSGGLAEAEVVCAQILAVDELNAGAHYLTALCREHAGDRQAAVDHDQTAAYLDGGFVMPHLHLGLLARRAGDQEQARDQLSRALMLLPREDASRILLFGGGFTREGLAAMCRSELRMCGGNP